MLPSRGTDLIEHHERAIRSERTARPRNQCPAVQATQPALQAFGKVMFACFKRCVDQFQAMLGDVKLESDGNVDKIAGKVQNAIGGLKDTLKGK
jgi:hypothetical protein